MAVERFGVSLKKELLGEFDEIIAKKGYGNRSEAIADSIRSFISEEKSRSGKGIGVIVFEYEHDVPGIGAELTRLQHEFHNVISSLHVHLGQHKCAEILVVKDEVKRINELADRLQSRRGVLITKRVILAD